VACMRGDHQTALASYREALEAYETVGDRPEEARVLDGLAWASLGLKETDDARSFFLRSIQAYEEVGSVRGIGIALFGLAATHQVEGRSSAAQQIAAAAEVFSTQEGIVNVFDEGSPAPAYLAAARESLRPEEVERLTEIGQQMSVQDAITFATEGS
jgi:tetratricopeptide (TPR) repeat protein